MKSPSRLRPWLVGFGVLGVALSLLFAVLPQSGQTPRPIAQPHGSAAAVSQGKVDPRLLGTWYVVEEATSDRDLGPGTRVRITMATLEEFALLEDGSYTSGLELTLSQAGAETLAQACQVDTAGHWTLDGTRLVMTLDDTAVTMRSAVRNGRAIDPGEIPEEFRCTALREGLPKGFTSEFDIRQIRSASVDVSDRSTGTPLTWHRHRPR